MDAFLTSARALTCFIIEFRDVDLARIALCLVPYDFVEKTLGTIIFGKIEEERARVEDKLILLRMPLPSFPHAALLSFDTLFS